MADTTAPELVSWLIQRGPGARALITGTANSGKTRLAAQVAAAWIHSKAPDTTLAQMTPSAHTGAGSVLVVCASHEGAVRAQTELTDAGVPGDAVRVVVAMDLELAILDAHRAELGKPGTTRVLTSLEESFLMEDLLSTGVRPRTLRQMTGFLRRGLSELADDDMGAFIRDPREYTVLTALQNRAARWDVLIDCQIAPACVKLLREGHQAFSANSAPDLVVADDWQRLSRASQQALELLAGQVPLLVLADPDGDARGADPFSYVEGIDEFLKTHQDAFNVELPSPIDGQTNALGAAASLAYSGYLNAASPLIVEQRGATEQPVDYPVRPTNPAQAGVAIHSLYDPTQEFEHLARYVSGLVNDGDPASSVAVLAPNRAWAVNAARALATTDVNVDLHDGRQPVAGDFRSLERSAEARVLALLQLAVDPKDPLATRVWCGCGDRMGRSEAFRQAERVADENGVGLADALELLARPSDLEPGPALAGVLAAYSEGLSAAKALIDANARGAALMQEAAHLVGLERLPARLAAVQLAEDADATAVVQAVRDACLHPFAGRRTDAVLVATYALAAGIKAKHAVVVGMMNGWIPKHAYFDAAEADFPQRRRMDAQARAQIYALSSTALSTLEFTGFGRCDLELAERMHLKGYQVGAVQGGGRYTTCHMSDLLAFAQHAWGLASVPAELLGPGIKTEKDA